MLPNQRRQRFTPDCGELLGVGDAGNLRSTQHDCRRKHGSSQRPTSGLVDAELGGEASLIDRLADDAVPLRRAGTPEEVATLIAFVASPACAYMTGETILLDGGYVLGPGMHIDSSGAYL